MSSNTNTSSTIENEQIASLASQVSKMEATIANLTSIMSGQYVPMSGQLCDNVETSSIYQPGTNIYLDIMLPFALTRTFLIIIGMDGTGRVVDMVNAHCRPNFMGERSIVATLPEARVGFVPTANNRTPSSTARINALINYLWKKKNRTEEDLPMRLVKTHRMQFKALTRQCRAIMKHDGVTAVFWNDMSPQVISYYSSKLESLITDYGFPIYQCNKRWAATLLLQDAMKAERQVALRNSR